jgi:N-acetylglucosaminyldiphosphoundecaprenol N-acetyl-beta-D-mannosaminyltransferase
MKIMDYDIYIDKLEQIDLTEKKIINTINPHSYIIAKSDDSFQEALKASDILIPDGSGIVLASKFIYKKNIKKVAGSDLHKFLLEKINKKNGKIFYMGASTDTLNKIEKKLNKEYPNIIMDSYSPPFKDFFSDKENQIIINRINAFSPDVLFIGMTAPKQEKWLYEHKNKLNFKVASSIGAVFDFYVGRIKRSSPFWINLHLEWLPRLIKEPKRLWRRNFISTPLFIINIIKYKIQTIYF